MSVAAAIAAILLGVITIFQLGLAFGAPWGAAAWGGRNPGVLPGPYRVASGIAAVAFYPFIIMIVLSSAGVIGDSSESPTTMWVLTGLFAVASLMNFISPSKVERIWGPVALAVSICCAVIASSL